MERRSLSRPWSRSTRQARGYRPRCEALEARLQPGDCLFGGLLGLSLTDTLATPLLLSTGEQSASVKFPLLQPREEGQTTFVVSEVSAAEPQVFTVEPLEQGIALVLFDGTEFDDLFTLESPVAPDALSQLNLGHPTEGARGMGSPGVFSPVGSASAPVPVGSSHIAVGPMTGQLELVVGASTAGPVGKPVGQRGADDPTTPPPPPGVAGPGPLRPGFNANTLPRNDDESTGEVAIGFPLIFYCSSTEYTTLYVNNNGNLTFRNPLGTYTPPPLGTLGQEIIAPFFADVDTRNPGSGVVTYGQGMVDGHLAFAANWIDVGYYNQRVNRLNTFQVVLIDRGDDIGYGDFDIEFNYGSMRWETGDASGGSGGLGGDSARVGYSTNEGAVTVELPGSAVNGAYLDGGPNALRTGSLNSGGVVGRYVFNVHGLRCVDVDQVNYNGARNVPIRIDGTTTIGSPGNPGGEAIEWVRDLRQGANTTANWDTSQAAPAAFIRGNALTAAARFSVREAGVTQLVINATTVSQSGASPYGNIPDTTVNIANGVGTANVTTDASINYVDYNDITIRWFLKSVVKNGMSEERNQNLRETTNRIYTLFADPNQAGFEPMRTPWARVLELATGLAFIRSTEQTVVEDLTRGIHHSSWRNLATPLHFVDAQATLIYNPSVVNSTPNGAGVPGSRTWWASQQYDLNYFLANINLPRFHQQCNDNSNLMTIMARSLGVNVTPTWLSDAVPINNGLERTAAYFPAGLSTSIRSDFTFHQFVVFNGRVYDPSTRPNAAGDPNMGATLNDYLDAVFPGQRTAGFDTIDLTTVSIGPRAISGFRFAGLAPDRVTVNSTTSITVAGVRLDATIRVRAFERGTLTPAANVTIANVVPAGDERSLTFDLTVAAGATARPIDVRIEKVGTTRAVPVLVTIDP